VYRAQDREHLVAIKTFRLDVPPEAAADMGEALRALVAAAPRVDGLVMPVGAGVEGETPWLALPHVGLATLDTRLRDEGAPPVERVLQLVAAMARAIDAAHARDLHHGSLHPRDVFVDADGRVLITGFGIAPALRAVGVRPPVRRPYTAPELITGTAPVDAEAPADHYALGAIAFELLTGHRLLAAGADLAPRLRRADGVPVESAATALAAMLAERPEHRPELASAFARTLAAALGHDIEALEPAGPPDDTVSLASVEGDDPDDALQLFARQGTLWEPRAEPVREVWVDSVPAAVATPVAALEEDVPTNPVPVTIDLDTGVDLATSFPSEEKPVAWRSATFEPQPELPTAETETPEPSPMPPPRVPVTLAAADPEAATGSPPGVVLALVLALGLAIGGAGGYLLGQRSGMRAAMRAQGGEAALAAEPRAEPAVETPAEPPAPAVPDAPEDSAPAAAPPARPAVRERPAPAEGQIVVRSTPPKAGVIVNGVWRGRTPLTIARLPLGTHAVRVVEDGRVAETRRVTLDARVPSATVSVSLERAAPARPASSATPSAAPPRPAATTGGLYLESRPRGARVFVDDQLVGTTPLLISELAPGRHRVRIEHDGYRAWFTTVTIAAGERTRVAASLEEEGLEERRP
jgi:serine/threonine-protein kinase